MAYLSSLCLDVPSAEIETASMFRLITCQLSAPVPTGTPFILTHALDCESGPACSIASRSLAVDAVNH